MYVLNSKNKKFAQQTSLEELEQVSVDYDFKMVWEDFYEERAIPFLVFHDGEILVPEQTYFKDKDTVLDIFAQIERTSSSYKVSRILLASDEVVYTKMVDANKAFEVASSSDVSEGNEALDEFESLLIAAQKIGSNDIHINALKSSQRAFALFSVDKVLRHDDIYRFISYDRCYAMLSAMYDTLGKKAGQTDFDGMSDQETSFSYTITPKSEHEEPIYITCRVAKTVPDRIDDIHVVIRLIELSEPMPIDKLGLPADKKAILIKNINRKQGAVLTSGPMGSGKSVTMSSALNEVSDDLQVQTVEDPIEIRFKRPNFVQNQLKKDFKRQLGLVLRQNVSVLYLGELRDQTTTEMFLKHIKSGHLGAATTHANSAMGIIQRLMDLNIPAVELAAPSVLSLLMAQRLEKKLCPHCKIPLSTETLDPENYELQQSWSLFKLENSQGVYMRNAEGCEHCHAGTKGRQLILEQIEIDKADRNFIRKTDWEGWNDHLKANGFDSIGEQTRRLILQGILCPISAIQSVAGD